MLIHIVLILYFCVLAGANNPILDYVSMEKNDLSVHPLSSTYLHEVPPITIEITPSNDTLINVYFTSTPQPLAILIHLNNSPHPLGTAYSAILITTNPPSEPNIYSGTITFISAVENSTVGFHIPPSANGAVITVDVPTGPLKQPTQTYPIAKTKIRLIQLKSPVNPTLQPGVTAEAQPSIATTQANGHSRTASESDSSTMQPTTFIEYFADDGNESTTDLNIEDSTWPYTYTTESSIEISTETISSFTETNNNNNSPSSTEYSLPTTFVPFDSTVELINWTSTPEIATYSTEESIDLSTASDESTEELTFTTPTPFDLFNTTNFISNVTEVGNETFSTGFDTFTTDSETFPTDSETFTTDSETFTTDSETFATDFEPMTTEATDEPTTFTDIFLNNTTFVTFENVTATSSSEQFTELSENITATESSTRSTPPKPSTDSTVPRASSTGRTTPNSTLLPLTIPTMWHLFTTVSSTVTTSSYATLSHSSVKPTRTSSKTYFPTSSTKTLPNSTSSEPHSLPTTVTPIKPIVVNTTCPTVYNIYVNFNLSASFNKTYIKASPSSKDDSRSNTTQVTPPLTATPTIPFTNTSLDDNVDEISIPRRIPDMTTTLRYSVATAKYNVTTPKYENNSSSTSLKANDTTEKTVFVTTVSSAIVNRTVEWNQSAEINQTVSPSTIDRNNTVSNLNLTSTATPVIVPEINLTQILPPTSYWLITVLVAKTDKVDDKFVAEMKESLEKAYDEAFKRQQKKILGINSGKKRVKRGNNQFINVQMVNVSQVHPDEIRMIYYLIHNESLIEVNSSLSAMQTLTEQEAALLFGHVVLVKAQPYLQVPTSSPLTTQESASLLPIILGSVSGFLLIVIIIIVLVKLKCIKRKPETALSSPSSTYGHRNRLRAMNDELTNVMVVEGGESVDGRAKLSSSNVLTNINQGPSQPPPLPLKPQRKRRPLPSIPGEYINIASSSDASADLMRICNAPVAHPRTRKNNALVHQMRSPMLDASDDYTLPKSSGILEYLHAPNSQVPQSVRAESAVIHLMDHQTETEEFDRKIAATQTDAQAVAERKLATPEPNSEIEVISSEIQWHSIRQKMQEMIDSAVATLKNTSPSPKFKRNQVQSQPISIISVESQPVSVHNSRRSSPEKRAKIEERSTGAATDLHSLLEQNIYSSDNLDLMQNYKKPAKDTETEYLLRAIKEELNKFKQNFNTPNPHNC